VWRFEFTLPDFNDSKCDKNMAKKKKKIRGEDESLQMPFVFSATFFRVGRNKRKKKKKFHLNQIKI